MRVVFSIMLGTLFLIACSSKGDKSFQMPEDYKGWKKPIKRVLDYPVPGHGMSYRVIYANDVAFTARTTKDRDGNESIIMPDGSIVLKEAYMKREDINKRIRDITIMVKSRDDKFALNGWLYYVKMPGKDIMRVNGKMCIGCHEAANEEHPYFDKNKGGIFRDYLFVKVAK